MPLYALATISACSIASLEGSRTRCLVKMSCRAYQLSSLLRPPGRISATTQPLHNLCSRLLNTAPSPISTTRAFLQVASSLNVVGGALTPILLVHVSPDGTNMVAMDEAGRLILFEDIPSLVKDPHHEHLAKRVLVIEPIGTPRYPTYSNTGVYLAYEHGRVGFVSVRSN